MISTRNSALSLYVDRSCPERWIVRDREGRFWLLPPGEDAWDRRVPFEPGEGATLEPVPGHYLSIIGLPI